MYWMTTLDLVIIFLTALLTGVATTIAVAGIRDTLRVARGHDSRRSEIASGQDRTALTGVASREGNMKRTALIATLGVVIAGGLGVGIGWHVADNDRDDGRTNVAQAPGRSLSEEADETDQNGLPLDEMPDPATGGTMHGTEGEKGLTPDDPLGPGDTFNLMDWDVTLSEPIIADDAQSLFSAYPHDQQSEIIGSGNTLITTEVTATRVTPGSGDPGMDLTITWFGPDGAEVGETVAMAPDEGERLGSMGTSEAFEGASITTLGALSIPHDAYDGGVWAISDYAGFRFFVAPE